MKSPMWVTIDFEDFAYDLKRALGVTGKWDIREAALDAAYLRIQEFLQTHHASRPATFFCTGVIARLYPDIIARIAKDGHEIACHYNFHDSARNDPPDVFEKNLQEGIDSLATAANQKIRGFRAPRFSLKLEDANHLDILARHVDYDSSFHFNSRVELDAAIAAGRNRGLNIIPVGKHRVIPGLPGVKTGGSYFKLFDKRIILSALRASRDNGLRPNFYLHPYDFIGDSSFMVTFRDLAGLSHAKRLYWHLRQYQWHVLGNRAASRKLEAISQHFSHQGTLIDLI